MQKKLAAVLLLLTMIISIMPVGTVFAADIYYGPDVTAIGNIISAAGISLNPLLPASWPSYVVKWSDDSENKRAVYLNVGSQDFTALDVSSLTELRELHCDRSNLTSLDVSALTKLEVLQCHNSKLATLNVANNAELVKLSCHANNLEELNISGSPKLEELICASNNITTLDITNNPLLKTLSCYNNDNLDTLNVSNNPLLESINCQNCSIKELDVSNNPLLIGVSCYNNNLKQLDLRNNTQLQYLDCINNSLGSLDITKNTQLKTLRCSNVKIDKLDVSQNTLLETLWCHNNSISELNVSRNILLKSFYCYSNRLTTLDVSKNAALEKLDCSLNFIFSQSDVKQDGHTYTLLFSPQKEVIKNERVSVRSEGAATVVFESNNEGEYWYVVQDASLPAPSSAALSAASAFKTDMAAGTNTLALSGLTSTAQTLYLMCVDDNSYYVSTILNISAYTAGGTSGGGGGGGTTKPTTQPEPPTVPILNNHAKYINGYPDGTMRPDNGITRAEAVAIFYRLFIDEEVNATGEFADIEGNEWFADAVYALAAKGIITGYEDGCFRPHSTITRAEFTAIASRLDEGAPEGRNSFPDVGDSEWFAQFVGNAANKGWITGFPDGTFRPNQGVTRVQVVTIINRMLERVPKEIPENVQGFSDISEDYWGYIDILEAATEHEYYLEDDTEVWAQ